ncbi:MAG TPA: competence/damage-inducible protein A [Gemmatimonadaceae bacterium]|nr:competence/damage-inducible protein A [Gemmatimonadaceae bacterium]
MRVELLTIGDELLLGFTIDTNSAFLGRELAELGIELPRRGTIGDDPDAIAAALREALDRADGVITTGGLGPTSDDVTMAAVASALGVELERNDAIVARLEEIWRSRGRSEPLPPANLSQAMIPRGAAILSNHHGTAPGAFVERADGRWVAVLPGVPREMREMFSGSVRDMLRSRAPSGQVVRSLAVRTTGVPESRLPALLGDYADGVDGLELAYIPSVEGVDLRLTARGIGSSAADATLRAAARKLSERLEPYAYADGTTDLAEVILEQCRGGKLRLAVAESCTGGMLGQRLTAIAGSSDVFAGGVIAYDNEVKIEMLGVAREDIERHGAVSEEIVTTMASSARRVFGVELGVAITGIAGPAGGSAEKPVGTVWIAVATPDEIVARRLRLFGDRDEIRRRAAQAALDLVRRSLAG